MDAEGYIECGDNRDEIVFPWLCDFILARKPATVLDFGCGDARFALEISRRLGGGVSAYERDPEMLARARRRIGCEPGSVELLPPPDASWHGRFDAIFLLGVWMCWETREECLTILGHLARSLRPGGVVIASITHPCFRDRDFATYRTDFDMSRYMENGVLFRVAIGQPGAETPVTDTHWNLAETFNQALEAGLTPIAVREHADAPGRPPSWLSLVFAQIGGRG